VLAKWALLVVVLLASATLISCTKHLLPKDVLSSLPELPSTSSLPQSTTIAPTTKNLPATTIQTINRFSPVIVSPTSNPDTTILSPETTAPESKDGWTAFTNGNEINAMLFKGKELWAATSGGVIRIDSENATYRKYTTLDGLANNDVHAIALDKQGRLWFGTNGGDFTEVQLEIREIRVGVG
jgi:hypothetical protein